MVAITDEDVLCRRVSRNPQCWESDSGLPQLSEFQRKRITPKKVKPPRYENGISVDVVRLLPGGVSNPDTPTHVFFCLPVAQAIQLGLRIEHDPVLANSEEGKMSGPNPAHALILSDHPPRDTKDAEGLRQIAQRCSEEVLA